MTLNINSLPYILEWYPAAIDLDQIAADIRWLTSSHDWNRGIPYPVSFYMWFSVSAGISLHASLLPPTALFLHLRQARSLHCRFLRDSSTTVSTWHDTCWLMSQYRNISPHFEPIFDCSRKHINRHIWPLFNLQPKPFSLSETYRVFPVATIYKQHLSCHCLKPGLAFQGIGHRRTIST